MMMDHPVGSTISVYLYAFFKTLLIYVSLSSLSGTWIVDGVHVHTVDLFFLQGGKPNTQKKTHFIS